MYRIFNKLKPYKIVFKNGKELSVEKKIAEVVLEKMEKRIECHDGDFQVFTAEKNHELRAMFQIKDIYYICKK